MGSNKIDLSGEIKPGYLWTFKNRLNWEKLVNLCGRENIFRIKLFY